MNKEENNYPPKRKWLCEEWWAVHPESVTYKKCNQLDCPHIIKTTIDGDIFYSCGPVNEVRPKLIWE